jgi:hypothetical protein
MGKRQGCAERVRGGENSGGSGEVELFWGTCGRSQPGRLGWKAEVFENGSSG